MKKEKFYRPKEVAWYLDVHYDTVLKWCRRGELKSFKLGNVVRISETDLQEFIKNKKPLQPDKPQGVLLSKHKIRITSFEGIVIYDGIKY